MTIPNTMRAVVLTGHGGLDKLVYREDWPTPQPKPDEVLVKIGACGLNNTDINTRTAWYSKTVRDGITDKGGKGGYAEAEAAQGSWSNTEITFPRIQGADVAGHIVAVGAEIDTTRIGERVIVDPWLHGHGEWHLAENACYFGSECDGGFADYVAIRASNAIPIQSDLTYAELATFPTVLTTAEHLVWRANPQPGEWVVIAGASGGVGTTVIQLCLLRGARIVAISTPEKAENLFALGCAAVVDRNSTSLENDIRDAAGGPVDVALDVVGGILFASLNGALRQRGRYSTSGAIAGPMVEFDLRHLIYKDLQFTGATITPPGLFARACRLIETGQLSPLLAATFPLKDLARAQEAFMAKTHVGNIVVAME
ncbi:Crotonyl-CoA reductase [Roseovarius albus]|uniref:Crotonyl-CoA reductase n=1 Tax=Roseovarius albus TaxID=1247867 RepID=A0A1X7A6Y9_9RHOB|nr:alcohol dehydrogenase family protein [Roseovarius albus]SLN72097.1 Crotonyl-CoA reductase [Roseovarius albus]